MPCRGEAACYVTLAAFLHDSDGDEGPGGASSNHYSDGDEGPGGASSNHSPVPR
jgi:hypothetical protein